MPNAFNFQSSPFDALNRTEQALVRDSVDIAYFRPNTVILEVGAVPSHLYILIKGHVAEIDNGEVLNMYGPDDTFDGRGLVAGRSSHRYEAQEEVLAYELPVAVVQQLIASNATFSALLFSNLGDKLSALSQRHSAHEMQSLTLARLDEALLHPPHYVSADTDVSDVARMFVEHKISHVLVRDEDGTLPKLGIFSATSLPKAILDGRPLNDLPVGDFAAYDLIALPPDAHMGEALTMMLRHRIHRIVVAQDDQILGVVESLDVFSFLSNHSHLLMSKIDQADSLEALAAAAAQSHHMVQQLQAGGTDIGQIGELVQQVNARLFERAWQLIAPEELVNNSCLIVMGSEGRGEQLLKTDQDNGLIWRDGYQPPDNIADICQAFSDALERFGYPLCPGQIMLSNPLWRGNESAWSERVRQWLIQASGDDLMNLAIFLDAHGVAGNERLLHNVRSRLWELATDNEGVLARFASAVDAFSAQPGLISRVLGLGDEALHLKKAGIFPIVHGMRSLALAYRITATSTAARARALVQEGVFKQAFCDEIIHSLHFLMGLRLKAGLAELALKQPVSGEIDPKAMSPLERDLLKDSLSVVKRFRSILQQRFRLNAL